MCQLYQYNTIQYNTIDFLLEKDLYKTNRNFYKNNSKHKHKLEKKRYNINISVQHQKGTPRKTALASI